MITLFLLLSLPPSICPAAQEPLFVDDPCPILVLNSSWDKFRYRPGWDRQSIPDQAGSLPTGPNTVARPNQRRLARVIEGFVYKATIKNTSQKAVTLVVWRYTFTDPVSKKQTHHEFQSRIRIKGGEKKELSKYVKEPPTRTISADGGGKEMEEEVRIEYIEYEDGSSWGIMKEAVKGR
jgi:hypothetical protein